MMYLDERFLMDTFHETGTKQEDFEELVRMIDRSTRHTDHVMKNLVLLSIDTVRTKELPGEVYCSYIDPQERMVDREVNSKDGPFLVPSVRRKRIRLNEILKYGNFAPVIRENLDTIGVFIFNKEVYGNLMDGNTPGTNSAEGKAKEFNSVMKKDEYNTALILSEMALNTLAQRLSLKATPLRKKGLERDLFIASLMNCDAHVTIVTKRCCGVSKIFAVLGTEFADTKLFLICEMYSLVQAEKRFGKMNCDSWDVTHKKASIRFCFPEYGAAMSEKYGFKEMLTPYVEYISSDTGANSLQVKSFWMTDEGHYIPGNTFSKRHRGKFEEAESFKKEVDEKIYQFFEDVPKRLHALQSIRISPEGFNRDSLRWMSKNRNTMLRAFRNAMLAIKEDCLGKKRRSDFLKLYDYGIVNETAEYTAYDLFMDIASIPAIVERKPEQFPDISKETLRKIREICIEKAFRLDYKKIGDEARNRVLKNAAAETEDPESENGAATVAVTVGDACNADTTDANDNFNEKVGISNADDNNAVTAIINKKSSEGPAA